MNIDFGSGIPLIDTSPWLRDEDARIERILDVSERNSVIEGLPPFDQEMRQRLRAELKALSKPSQAHGE